MAEVRRRNPPTKSLDARIQEEDDDKPLSKSISLLDILRILGGIALLNSALSYYLTKDPIAWNYRPWWVKPARIRHWLNGPISLTDAELASYDGTDPSKPIYLALNGTIYDVTSGGAAYYGAGGMYGFFSGKDASRAFVTGCFDTDLTPDLRGVDDMYMPLEDDDEAPLSKGELKTRKERERRLARQQVAQVIEGWAQVFRGDTGKDYFAAGTVKREEGWLDMLPRRELCERARKQRKKRGEAKRQGQ